MENKNGWRIKPQKMFGTLTILFGICLIISMSWFVFKLITTDVIVENAIPQLMGLKMYAYGAIVSTLIFGTGTIFCGVVTLGLTSCEKPKDRTLKQKERKR